MRLRDRKDRGFPSPSPLLHLLLLLLFPFLFYLAQASADDREMQIPATHCHWVMSASPFIEFNPPLPRLLHLSSGFLSLSFFSLSCVFAPVDGLPLPLLPSLWAVYIVCFIFQGSCSLFFQSPPLSPLFSPNDVLFRQCQVGRLRNCHDVGKSYHDCLIEAHWINPHRLKLALLKAAVHRVNCLRQRVNHSGDNGGRNYRAWQ